MDGIHLRINLDVVMFITTTQQQRYCRGLRPVSIKLWNFFRMPSSATDLSMPILGSELLIFTAFKHFLLLK